MIANLIIMEHNSLLVIAMDFCKSLLLNRMVHKNTPKHFRLMTDQHGRLLGHIQNMNQSLHLVDMIIKLKFGAKISKEIGKILFIKSSLVNLLIVLPGLLGNMD
jgi:hypothetical protein